MNIVFEGLPGAGKSTIIQVLQLELDNSIVLNEFLDNIQGDNRDIEYFLTNERMKYEIMKGKKNDFCLVDRFWQSTLVYNAVSCGATNLEELKSLYKILYKDQVFEDYTYVYLRVPSNISLIRHTNVGIDDCIWFNKSFNQKALYIYDMIYENIQEFSPSCNSKYKLDTKEQDFDTIFKTLRSILKS